VGDAVVDWVGVGKEFLGGMDLGFFLPVNRDFGLGHFCALMLRHVPPPGHRMAEGSHDSQANVARITPGCRCPKVRRWPPHKRAARPRRVLPDPPCRCRRGDRIDGLLRRMKTRSLSPATL